MLGRRKEHAEKKPMTASETEDDLEIYIQDVSQSSSVPGAGRLKAWIRSVFEPDRRGELTVRIVDESESAALNGRYRQGEGATNVLAFPAEDPRIPTAVEPPEIGDLVICAPVLEREAGVQSKSLEAHWAHITVHGALHLLGFDHADEAGAAEMEAREVELLGVLGFDDPYADDE
jgi:probable rRNA maturation factor